MGLPKADKLIRLTPAQRHPIFEIRPQTAHNNMNTEKVVFAFFIVLALTLNFGFMLGDIDNPDHHNVYELYAALVVSLIATIMKFGDRTHVGAVLLATSLVADLQLIVAAIIWGSANHLMDSGLDAAMMASIVSLSAGAVLANVTSVILLILETMMVRH
jgi:Ca2+/H+ antiporter, TMEM165/GDT1 family